MAPISYPLFHPYIGFIYAGHTYTILRHGETYFFIDTLGEATTITTANGFHYLSFVVLHNAISKVELRGHEREDDGSLPDTLKRFDLGVIQGPNNDETKKKIVDFFHIVDDSNIPSEG